MADVYATEFSEIPFALANNAPLREQVLALIARKPMPGKATEGTGRLAAFRDILARTVVGEQTLGATSAAVERALPPDTSPHYGNARVFSAGWAERLVRTQLSRCYNQAVLEAVLARGDARVFVPHSSEEAGDSKCTRLLAGQEHDARELLERLVRAYAQGDWSSDVKVPDHPHCTHVVAPAS